jgi:two-component system sensor histidine kinase CiaH
MKNISKQFVEWVISFKYSTFSIARLKISAIFTLGIFTVLVVFNFLVFGLFIQDQPEQLETPETEAIEERLESVLYVADSLILIFVALMSYILAGFVLKPIEKSFNQQKNFVADAAHELRTPLTVMKAGAETILAGDSGEKEYKNLTKDFLEETSHLSAIVDDLLFLAKNDQKKKLHFVKFDLSKLLLKQVNLLHITAEKKNITIKNEISPEIFFFGNVGQIKRLINNLLTNAIHYNKQSGKINVFLQKKRGRIEIKIVDTGIGIARKDISQLYDRFFKTDKARTIHSSGAGLGLSIAKEIVDIHKGIISISSAEGEGTTVSVCFKNLYS